MDDLLDKLDEEKLEYVAGGSDSGGATDELKKAQDALSVWQNKVPKAERSTDKNDKAGWKAWWEYRKRRPFCCVLGTCARCGKRIGTNGSLCRECRDWVYSLNLEVRGLIPSATRAKTKDKNNFFNYVSEHAI